MLITQEVEINLNGGTRTYWQNLGYEIIERIDNKGRLTVPKGTNIKVKTSDLPAHSKVIVKIKCDGCGEILNVGWSEYIKCRKEDHRYYCKRCARTLNGTRNMIATKLLNGKSFGDWCIENSRDDILIRWDYDKNDCKPNEINCKTNKKYYFKCPKGIHSSELKLISSFTIGQEGSMDCKACNSFAQWGIDNICSDFLEKYWDYKMNIEVNPYQIEYGCHKQIWIKCQNKNHHESYGLSCNAFTVGNRCPKCNSSKGEIKIEAWLNLNQIEYAPQKPYKGLLGLGKRLLSYDFYLPLPYNILIEYQGIQHYEPIDYFGGEIQFKKQKKHDELKLKYAESHNIQLLVISYLDYDNINYILSKQLNISSVQEAI